MFHETNPARLKQKQREKGNGVLLRLRNIGKIYDSNGILTIGIRNVELGFDNNEFVTIEGESGSGKSTLLNVIGANDSYEEGELYFNGEPTSHYSESDWEKYREKNIATVFQDFNIIENLTVLENVELALLRLDDKKERRRRAKELIARVGLTEQMNRRGSKLSGGEKQRTVIARALAKDAPIILADEPTGNLDVKASQEVAALLKEVSKDKLVIVVTHNPEFFRQYATRRIRMYDGRVSEDQMLERPAPVLQSARTEELPVSRFHHFRNTLHVGTLNYKSRPKFTTMMSLALAVCAVTLFLVIALFGQNLIRPLTATLDGVGISGKVIVSGTGDRITADTLDELAYETGAGFILGDRTLSEFTVTIPESGDMLGDYEVICLYSPYEYNLSENEGVLVLPRSAGNDAQAIVSAFTGAGVGLESIEVKASLTAEDVRLYLGYGALAENGLKIQAINSTIRLGEDETTVYTFTVNSALADGNINLVNSNYFNVVGRTAVFTAKADKAYMIADASGKNDSVSGLIVEMSEADYDAMFENDLSDAMQACLYFSSEEAARGAIDGLPEGYMGLLSGSNVYVQGAGDVFTEDVLWYVALIAVSLLIGVLISIIFMRSVKIYQADFAVYRTLGIPKKVSSRSLYIQMALIFLPALMLLPLVSIIAAIIPGSSLTFISVGNYFFIEVMLLLIVELVAFGFNKSLNGQSIRKSLRRGSK